MMVSQFDEMDEIEKSYYKDGQDVLDFYDIDGTSVGAEIGYMILYFTFIFLLT
jgi:hypothetical protein